MAERIRAFWRPLSKVGSPRPIARSAESRTVSGSMALGGHLLRLFAVTYTLMFGAASPNNAQRHRPSTMLCHLRRMLVQLLYRNGIRAVPLHDTPLHQANDVSSGHAADHLPPSDGYATSPGSDVVVQLLRRLCIDRPAAALWFILLDSDRPHLASSAMGVHARYRISWVPSRRS